MKCPNCDGKGKTTEYDGLRKFWCDYKCEHCNGTGEVMTDDIKIKCDDCKFVEECVDYGWVGCRKFTPKPSEPMTNEEWFNTLSTEEKAKWLSKISKFFHECGKRDVYPKTMYEEDWECWLKEKHT